MAKKPTYEELEKRVKQLEEDAAKRKYVQEALRESELRYRTIFDHTSDGVSIYERFSGNLKRKLIDCNKSYAEMAGRSKEELCSIADIQEFQHNSHTKEDSWIIQRKIEQVLHYEGTFSWTRPDGKENYIEYRAVPFRIGKRIFVCGIDRDITERVRAEKALRESEEKYRSIFELSPQAIALTDFKTGKLIEFNDRFCELFKYTRNEILGRTTVDLGIYSKDDRKRFLKVLQKSGEIHGLEMDLKAKDGTILNTLMFARVIQITGEIFIITMFFDLTDQKRLEAQLRQAQKIEAIGTLAGGIAHDFNNLLMGIQGNASLMLLDIDSGHSHHEKLKHIEQYVLRGSELTRQLLGFARGGKYEVKPTDLNVIIEKSSEMFCSTKKEIRVHRKYQKDIWTVEVDRGQVEQVLLNLYVNAWQAMPGGGKLYIETENISLDKTPVQLDQSESEKYVRISIRDTGSGMDEATQQRLFDPFFTTKEMGRGTGLGLASVYGIIKNHSGFINVSSQKGEGATFSIYLPASEKEVIKEKRADTEMLEGKETVLLVDDEEMILDVGQEILKTLGYKVILAGSGKEAIEIVNKARDAVPSAPDLVILDMIMPDMEGGKVYDKLKEANPDIKVLLSSGYSIKGQASEIMERGCNGFIQKPFNINDLSQKIREILDN